MDNFMNVVVSYGYFTTRPCGKYFDSASIFCRAAFAVARAFAPVAR
jgi:hypothetical protein